MRETVEALTRNPMQVVWRYVFALLGGFLAMGLHVFLSFRGVSWFAPQRWSNMLGAGLLFGHAFAFLVILGNEYPRRLRGVWSFWLIFVVSLIANLLFGVIVWMIHHLFFLLIVPPDWSILLVGAVAISLGLLISALVNIPVWGAMAIMFVATCASIIITFQRFSMSNAVSNPPIALLYFAPNRPDLMWIIAVLFSALLTLGAFLPLLWRGRNNAT